MGFLDNLKQKLKQIKEENKNFGKTMARNNNIQEYYGHVNYSVKDGDFRQMSSVNIENKKGVIYNTTFDDYLFDKEDIVSAKYIGPGQHVNQQQTQVPTARFTVEFSDGKTAEMDIIIKKLSEFIAVFEVKAMSDFLVEYLKK